MDILRHLGLSSVAYAAEGVSGGADEPAALDPATSAADPPASVPADDPAAAVAVDPPAADPAPEPQRAPAMVPLRVLQQRVGEVTNKNRAAEQRATAAEQKAADLQAILDRMQAERGGTPAPDPQRMTAPTAHQPQPPPEFDRAVNAEAQRLRLYDDTMAVRAAGEAKYKASFGESLAILTAVGATSDEFVSDLFAVDKAAAHDILERLAKDPERAATLVAMDNRHRIAELTRMSDALKMPAASADPKPVAAAADPAPKQSRAPAPKPVLAPQAAAPAIDPTTPEGNEKMSDADFEKWYKDKYYKRA